MALPDSWLDHLFGKLAVRYGDAWDRKWNGVPMHLVRADWADVLGGMSGEAITYGLQHLPADFPPTAEAFRQLCNEQRPVGLPLLPPPVAINHAAVARIRAQADEVATAGLVRQREREAKERQNRPRTTVATPDRPRAPQGPLPWPRGVPKLDGDASQNPTGEPR